MKHFTEPTDEIYELVVGSDQLVAVVSGNLAKKELVEPPKWAHV